MLKIIIRLQNFSEGPQSRVFLAAVCLSYYAVHSAGRKLRQTLDIVQWCRLSATQASLKTLELAHHAVSLFFCFFCFFRYTLLSYFVFIKFACFKMAYTCVKLLDALSILTSEVHCVYPPFLSQSGTIMDRDSLIGRYFSMGINYMEILAFLVMYHGICLSMRQLSRILRDEAFHGENSKAL